MHFLKVSGRDSWPETPISYAGAYPTYYISGKLHIKGFLGKLPCGITTTFYLYGLHRILTSIACMHCESSRSPGIFAIDSLTICCSYTNYGKSRIMDRLSPIVFTLYKSGSTMDSSLSEQDTAHKKVKTNSRIIYKVLIAVLLSA